MSFDLYVEQVPGKGRGVFAGQPIPKGAIIEVCPVIVLSSKESSVVEKTILGSYIFKWPGTKQKAVDKNWTRSCVVLGNGSILNHSSTPNTHWYIRQTKLVVVFRAKRLINIGEELTHDYGWPKSYQTTLTEI